MDEAPVPRVRLAEMGDKYAETENVEIDCYNRVHLLPRPVLLVSASSLPSRPGRGCSPLGLRHPYWIKQGAEATVFTRTARRALHHPLPASARLNRKYDCRQRQPAFWYRFRELHPSPLPSPRKEAAG